jgi:hypothetical protein
MSRSQLSLENSAGPLDRRLLSLFVSGPSDVSSLIAHRKSHFACFLAWDTRDVSVQAISALAEVLFDRGLAYLCAWGPGCERVHDIFDEVELGLRNRPPDSVVMTTWHASEPLEEALWFFVNSTFPDAAYEDSCPEGIAITIGNSEWAASVKGYLTDPKRLNDAVGLDRGRAI